MKSKTKIVVEGLAGLGLALAQFGVAVAVSTVEVTVQTLLDIRRAVELERQTEAVARAHGVIKLAREYDLTQRDARAAEALERVVVRSRGDIFSQGVLDPPVPPAVHRRLDCRPWCGHNYQEDGVPLLFRAPDHLKPADWTGAYGCAWMEGPAPTIVWCTPECRAAKRPPNPTAPAEAPRS